MPATPTSKSNGVCVLINSSSSSSAKKGSSNGSSSDKRGGVDEGLRQLAGQQQICVCQHVAKQGGSSRQGS
jgi:hypothetical protein